MMPQRDTSSTSINQLVLCKAINNSTCVRVCVCVCDWSAYPQHNSTANCNHRQNTANGIHTAPIMSMHIPPGGGRVRCADINITTMAGPLLCVCGLTAHVKTLLSIHPVTNWSYWPPIRSRYFQLLWSSSLEVKFVYTATQMPPQWLCRHRHCQCTAYAAAQTDFGL